MPGLEIKIKPKAQMGMDGGQEQEKSEISEIKDMADKISAMCDSLMQREEEEDQEEQGGNEESNMPSSLAEKANFVRNYK